MGRIQRRTEILEELCGNIIDQVVSFNLHEEEAKEQDKSMITAQNW